MLNKADDADTDDDIVLTSWEARNRKYIQQLIMQKKEAQVQSQQAVKQEQKLKLKLARRVLGASFQRLYPHQAATLFRSPNAGAASNSASDSDDAGGDTSPSPASKQLERIDSHSRVPKLPPLTDACDAACAPDDTAAAALGVSADAAAAGLRREVTDGTPASSSSSSSGGGSGAGSGGSGGCTAAGNGNGATVHAVHGRVGGTLRRQPNQLSRSVSVQCTSGLHSVPYFGDSSVSGGGGGCGGGGVNNSRNLQQQQLRASQPLRSRRRRSTFLDPPSKPARQAASGGGDGGGNDSVGGGDGDNDDGPDVAVSDRRAFRQDKALRPQPYSTQPQAPVLAVAARSTSRLTATTLGLAPTPSGYAQWRGRTQLSEGQRTFCISGSGNHSQGIRAGLLARGWYENPDRNSPFFDFKWAANPLDINHDMLWAGQIVNHFRHSSRLTTKHGLCYTVRDTVWYEAADAAAFYPRSYDITDETTRREFLQDVRWTAAESLIKRAVIDGAICTTHMPYSPRRKSNSHSSQHRQQQQQQYGKAPQAPPPAAADASGGGSGGGGSSGTNGALPPADDASDGTAAGGEETSGGGGGGGGGVQRLQQLPASTPLVDLPSLRLACRIVAARLRHQRHLRVVHGGGGGRGGGARGSGRDDSDELPAGMEPSTAQWQQLLKHVALSCSAPVLPPPQFDPNWITCRTFITSAMLPQTSSTSQAGKSSGGGGGGGGGTCGRLSPGRKSCSHGAAGKGDRGVQGRRRGGAGGGGAGTETDGEAGGGGSASDGNGSGESEGGEGVRPSELSPPSAVGVAEDGEAAAAAAAAAKPSGPVVVADAAELLREVYGRDLTRRSAPLPHLREGARSPSPSPSSSSWPSSSSSSSVPADAQADDVNELEAVLSAPSASSSSLSQLATAAPVAAAAAAAEGSDTGRSKGSGGGGGATDGTADAVAAADGSWLPEDLPAICYDDEALQALDASTWRDAAEAIMAALEGSAVQTHISGTNNIWIVKPAGKSRGRGIRLFNDPDTLLSYVRGEEAQGLEARWIAQKYVERPLVIRQRKFDIRQWVLVTDWNPLQAWFYSTCYLRFAADDYDPNNLDVFQHLTNNSVSKYYEGPKKEDEITTSGNMWSIPRFQHWLAEVYGRDDIWQLLLQPAMRHIAICTLKSAQDHITPRKGSCQLYGYDFLIDDQLRVWLLEVNSSPTMEPSTTITSQLCADVQEDILKVVVDLPEQLAAAARRQARGGGGGGVEQAGGGDPRVAPPAAVDTGKWECIIDGGEELRPPSYTGLNLELKGTAIHLPPPRSNFAGRLYAATRHQQPPQQPPQQPQPQSATASSEALTDDASQGSGGSGSGGGGTAADSTAAVSGRRSGLSPTRTSAAAVAVAAGSGGVSAAASPGVSVRSSSLPSLDTPAVDTADRQPLQPHHGHVQHQQQQQHGGGGGEDELGGGFGFSGGGGGAAMMAARMHSGATPPPSRGGHTSPVRCRTPRISAWPVLSTHWDSGGFVVGSFGDPAAAISRLGSGGSGGSGGGGGDGGGGGGGGMSVHPASRILTPRGDVTVSVPSVASPPPAAPAAAAAAVAVSAAALLIPLSPSPSLNLLSPTAMRMPLLARPGHTSASGLALRAHGGGGARR